MIRLKTGQAILLRLSKKHTIGFENVNGVGVAFNYIYHNTLTAPNTSVLIRKFSVPTNIHAQSSGILHKVYYKSLYVHVAECAVF